MVLRIKEDCVRYITHHWECCLTKSMAPFKMRQRGEIEREKESEKFGIIVGVMMRPWAVQSPKAISRDYLLSFILPSNLISMTHV